MGQGIKVVSQPETMWELRYAQEAYVFGTAPNDFLVQQGHRLPSKRQALAVADGEGRNGVWLAKQGLVVLSIDSSSVAQVKAARLAQDQGVDITLELADISTWPWPVAEFDVVAGIFIQFAPPALRAMIFSRMMEALKPGGLLLLQGYRPEQLKYGTGGPSIEENLYTEDLLRAAFRDLEIVELRAHDSEIHEGLGHSGMSALIDLVAFKRAV